MLLDRVLKSSAVAATVVIAATIGLSGCGSDSGSAESGGSMASGTSASPTPSDTAAGTSFDITITGSENVAVQGTEMQCMAGSWAITGDVDPAIGAGFEVFGLTDPNGDFSAESLSVKWVSPKSAYLSTSSKGFTLSDDDLTATLDNVEVQSEKGTAKVNGTMVCGG
ncbi:MAG: hypothetical protein LH645_05790 [Actinomycetia bacterium]|nr:hypothetical protein [Actinomycetes bacterium]